MTAVALLSLAVTWAVVAQDSGIELDAEYEYGLKAQYIERIARFVEWPPSSTVADLERPFVIAVIGDNPFESYLAEMADRRQIKGKQVVVREVKRTADLVDPQILFIARSEEHRLGEILAWATGRPVLTVADTPGFADRGVHVNFYREGDHVRFEVNPSAARSCNLEPSSKLLRLARIVGPLVEP